MNGLYVTLRDLLNFLQRSSDPETSGKNTLYTLGHAFPDADALVSSLFLALAYDRSGLGDVRVSFLLPHGTEEIPAEVRFLLGEEISSLLKTFPTPDDPIVADALRSGVAGLITVDQSGAPGLDRYVRGILDHHPGQIGPEVAAPPEAVRVEPVGATASLVADVWRSLGLFPDETLRRILAGAILADTEGLSPSKVRDADRAAIEWLGFSDTCAYKTLWSGFLNALLSETDVHRLIARDFREFPIPGGTIGFAVIKCKEENMPAPADIRAALSALAVEKGYRVCLAKLASYAPGENGIPARWASDRLLIAGTDPKTLASFSAALASRLPGSLPDTDGLVRLLTPMSRKKLREPVLAAASEVFK